MYNHFITLVLFINDNYPRSLGRDKCKDYAEH